MSRALRLLGILAVLWLLPWQARAEAPVTLILSDAGPAYQEVAYAFQGPAGLRRPVRVLVLGDVPPAELKRLSGMPGLIVPVGLKATQTLAAQHAGTASVLALLVPRASFSAIAWPAGLAPRKVGAVYLDQPVSRLLATVEAALPNARRIGVVLSPENDWLVAQLRQEAARRQMSLAVGKAGSVDEVASALRQTLPESDVLLLVPDAVVVNAGSIQNVLLTTYRYRVPVVGFSQGLVRAGAVVAVYTGLGDLGRLGADLARQWNPATGEIPAPRYPQAFDLAINGQVARSLLLGLPDEAELRRRIGTDAP